MQKITPFLWFNHNAEEAVVPAVLMKLISGKDTAKVHRVMQAMMQMVKLDIKKLKQAAASGGKATRHEQKRAKK